MNEIESQLGSKKYQNLLALLEQYDVLEKMLMGGNPQFYESPNKIEGAEDMSKYPEVINYGR